MPPRRTRNADNANPADQPDEQEEIAGEHDDINEGQDQPKEGHGHSSDKEEQETTPTDLIGEPLPAATPSLESALISALGKLAERSSTKGADVSRPDKFSGSD